MFDIGMTEMMVIGGVALIVVGPKDLPGMFRTVGQFVGKAKGMAREFSSAMNAAADEAGVSEINKTIKAAANPQKFGMDKVREATKFDLNEGASKPELSAERKATAKKMNDAMAKAATDRQAKQAAAAASEVATPKETAPEEAAVPKKPIAKKAATKKPTAKKPAAKKPATKKSTVTKTAVKKPVAKKPAAAKPAAPKKAKPKAKSAAAPKDPE